MKRSSTLTAFSCILLKKTKQLLLSVILYGFCFTASAQYCTPDGAFSACALGLNDFWITDVSFTGAGSTFAYTGGTCVSTAPFYLNTNYTGDVVAGNTYTLSITRKGNKYKTYFNVWVDWDNNGALSDATPFVENIAPNMLLAANGGLTSAATVTVPAGVTSGVHRMRVRVQYNVLNTNNPCLTTGQAETKDFNLNVTGDISGTTDMNNNPSSIILYPNPAQQMFAIELKQTNFDIIITDPTGRTIFKSKNVSGKTEIDSRAFPDGIYFVSIRTDEQTVYNQKIIIAR